MICVMIGCLWQVPQDGDCRKLCDNEIVLCRAEDLNVLLTRLDLNRAVVYEWI